MNAQQLAKRPRVQPPVGGPSLTKQSMRDECDINKIMAKFQKTGAITHYNRHSGEYGFASALDFRDSLDLVKKGQDIFNDLPSSIRKRFANDPAEFLEFAQNDENKEEMVKIGLTASPEPKSATLAEEVAEILQPADTPSEDT